MFNLKKVNHHHQKSKIQYSINPLNSSLSKTHITLDLLSNKVSSSTSNNATLQHNNSMNLMLEKYKGDSLTKTINSSWLINNNKNITRMKMPN